MPSSWIRHFNVEVSLTYGITANFSKNYIIKSIYKYNIDKINC